MSDHELARQVAALRTEVREVRRLVEALHATLTARPPRPEPAVTADGHRFLPGTGTLGHRPPLSDTAQAALAHLDAQEPHHP